MKAVAVVTVLCLAVGCGGDDEDNNANGSANNTPANNTTADNTDPNGDPNADPNNTGGGEFLRASGSVNGAAFSVDCDPDHPETSSFTSGSYLGHDQCFGGVGNHQIQCATTEEGIGGVNGTIVVNIGINEAADDTISVSGSLETVNNLGATSANLVESTVTLDSYELGVGAAGSFTASWEDDGGPVFGDVTGTFNFNCDE
jgi:hypothetical protein